MTKYSKKRSGFERSSDRFVLKASQPHPELNQAFGSAGWPNFALNQAFSSAGSVRTEVRELNRSSSRWERQTQKCTYDISRILLSRASCPTPLSSYH